MKKVQIAFRANGTYENIIQQAVKGFENDVGIKQFSRGMKVNPEEVADLHFLSSNKLLTDGTVSRIVWPSREPFGIDYMVAEAYKKSYCPEEKEDMLRVLFGKVNAAFPPKKILLCTNNIEDHPTWKCPMKEYSSTWETTGLEFYTNLLREVTGITPTHHQDTPMERNPDETDQWVVVDRHLEKGRRDFGGNEWGEKNLVLRVPLENLLDEVAALGLIDQNNLGLCTQSAVDSVREWIQSALKK